MQVTFYFRDEDMYLVRMLDELARRQRRSRSAVLLSILEEYFQRGKRLGEILVDIGGATPEDIEQGLKIQRKVGGRPLGEILVEKGIASSEDVEHALTIQSRVRASQQ